MIYFIFTIEYCLSLTSNHLTVINKFRLIIPFTRFLKSRCSSV